MLKGPLKIFPFISVSWSFSAVVNFKKKFIHVSVFVQHF